MIYGDTLSTMIGAVKGHKQNASSSLCTTWLNWRMRSLFLLRPYWAGGITRGVLNIPAPYTTGTISLTPGSNVVTGTSTSWPVSDVVNTTLNNLVAQPGSNVVMPASMVNISSDTWLYVDATGATPEVVYVLDTTPTSFIANFSFPHAAGATVTCSSLTSQTLRLGYQNPNYLITAVTSSTNLLIEFGYAGSVITLGSYTILKNLYNFAPDLKELLSVVDPQQGYELEKGHSLEELNSGDPQRSSTGWPQWIVWNSISPAGTMLYEIWPSPTAGRPLYFTYYKQPKDLRAGGDRPPAYIDPQVLIAGAIADALRTKIGSDGPDMFYDPDSANIWEQKFMMLTERLIYADNALANQSYTWDGKGGMPRGSNFATSHDPDVWYGNY